MNKLYERWVEKGVPPTLVHAYAFCVSQSRCWQDDWDKASLILVHLIGVHLKVWELNI